MPDSSAAPSSAGGGGGGFKAAMTGKVGPLPTWAWLGLITVALLGYAIISAKKSSAASGQQQQGTPADVGQPGVVVINQGGPGGPPGPPGPRGRGDKDHPPNEPGTRQIILDRNETLAQLAKQRHWNAETLADVEEMNVTQGQGEWTGKTKLRKGQAVIRPIGAP